MEVTNPTRFVAGALALVLGVTTGGGAAASSREKWGPFGGRVVDLETGQPITGAVMLVLWREIHGVGFYEHRFYDAREAVTDSNGRWEVPTLSVPFWRMGIQEPEFHLFAPGYEVHDDVVAPKTGKVYIDPTVTQMRRLKTRDERLRNQRRYPPIGPSQKMPKMLEAVNSERAVLGLEPIEKGDLQ